MDHQYAAPTAIRGTTMARYPRRPLLAQASQTASVCSCWDFIFTQPIHSPVRSLPPGFTSVAHDSLLDKHVIILPCGAATWSRLSSGPPAKIMAIKEPKIAARIASSYLASIEDLPFITGDPSAFSTMHTTSRIPLSRPPYSYDPVFQCQSSKWRRHEYLVSQV
jgi:hypothetical protein